MWMKWSARNRFIQCRFRNPFIAIYSGWIHYIRHIIDLTWHHEDEDVLHHLHRQTGSLFLGTECYSASARPHSATDSGYSAMAGTNLGAIWIFSSPRWCFLFSFVPRNYLTSGFFSWWKMFPLPVLVFSHHAAILGWPVLAAQWKQSCGSTAGYSLHQIQKFIWKPWLVFDTGKCDWLSMSSLV